MNRVNPIPVASLGKFNSAGFREQLDLTLGCGVGGEAGSALNPHGGGDVDGAATTTFMHCRYDQTNAHVPSFILASAVQLALAFATTELLAVGYTRVRQNIASKNTDRILNRGLVWIPAVGLNRK